MAAKKKKKTSKPEKRWVRIDSHTLATERLLSKIPRDVLAGTLRHHHASRGRALFTDARHDGVDFYVATDPGDPRDHLQTHADLGTFHDALLGALG